ncbi:MAG: CinA family protein [Synergistaceae bacterium]|nr:CinA family protein [Synergistaceae bacterium]
MPEEAWDMERYAGRALDLSKDLKCAVCPGSECGNIFTFAESCTGGLLASAVTMIPGSSEVFPGSVVTYSNRAKIEMLSVTPETIEKYGAVSAQCAAEMALAALRLHAVTIAVSVTGIAGPGGGSDEKPVGTVWFAMAHSSGRMRLKRGYFPDRDRRGTQERAVIAALDLLIGGLQYELSTR